MPKRTICPVVAPTITGERLKSMDIFLRLRVKVKKKVIEKYNLLNGLTFDCFIDSKQIHRYAHHLNSSQVLCYNYFRPLIDNNHHPKKELIKLMKDAGISILSKSECGFEHVEDEKEGTSFDFYVKDGDVEAFFEIKYTENDFGKAEDDDSHRKKFENTYRKFLQNCKCLTDNKKVDFEEFRKFYQLYRNVLRVTDKQKYVVFVFPKENDHVKKEFDAFIEKINSEYCNNVKCLYWEDIVEKDTELYKKYFAE